MRRRVIVTRRTLSRVEGHALYLAAEAIEHAISGNGALCAAYIAAGRALAETFAPPLARRRVIVVRPKERLA